MAAGLSATPGAGTLRRSMPTRSESDSVRRLMLFFAVVYTVEGIGQAKVGIVWQPLTYFLKTQYGWTALQIAASLAVLDVPWVIKPLYGADLRFPAVVRLSAAQLPAAVEPGGGRGVRLGDAGRWRPARSSSRCC